VLDQKINLPASSSSENRTQLLARQSNSEAHKKNPLEKRMGSSRYMPSRKYKVFPAAVIKAVRTGYTKQYAFFFLLRRFYQNGKIYHKNPRYIAERTGISVYLIKKYIKDLKYCNLIEEDGDMIILKSNNDLKNILDYKRYYHIEIRPGDTLKDVELNIKSIAVKHFAVQQIYVAGCRRDKLKMGGSDSRIDLKKYKKINRTLTKSRISGVSEPNAILSARYLRRVAKVSCSDFKRFRELTHSRHGWVWNTGTSFIGTGKTVGVCRSMWPSRELEDSKGVPMYIVYIPSIVYNIHSNTLPPI